MCSLTIECVLLFSKDTQQEYSIDFAQALLGLSSETDAAGKRDLYAGKRGLCTGKRDQFRQVILGLSSEEGVHLDAGISGVYCKKPRETSIGMSVDTDGLENTFCSKRTHSIVRDPHVEAKEAYVKSKDAYGEAKDACGEAKETCGEANEACGEAKETYVEAKEASPELAHGFTDVEVEEYREAFGLFDQDGGGTITAVEIGTVLRSIGPKPKPET